MKLRLYAAILLALTAGLTAASRIEAQDARQLVDRFERAYRPSRTLQATFFERYLENGKAVRSETGTAYFGRPGKMRWEYTSPEPNLFLIDGKWSWFYVPSDHSVTRVRAKDSSDWRTPLALLAGQMRVSRLCSSVALDTSRPPVDSRHTVLACMLRESDEGSPSRKQGADALPSAPRERVLFEVNSTTGELSRILVSDPGGVEIEFRFADWKFDPPLDAAKFRFAPPKGVAIVDGDLTMPGAIAPAAGSASLRVN